MAALTMPALVANYQKKVLETRIAKFYSVFNQVLNTKKAEDNNLDTSMYKSAYDPDDIEEYFNVNYKSYIKIDEFKKLTQGIAVSFPDGSGMYLYFGPNSTPYISWCVDYRKCKNIDEANITSINNGKDIFAFREYGPPRSTWDGTREDLVSKCAANPANRDSLCSTLIQYDGWEIKDDYPW